MHLTPADLQILVRLGDGMTQSQIGSDLGVEQPAVSKLIHAAEQRLGLALVYVDGRRLRLTSVGRELARAARSVLMQVKSIDDLVVSIRAGRVSQARIVASSTPGTYLLPPLIAEFLQARHDVQVAIEVVPMAALWAEFLSGAYDIAVTPRLPFTGSVTAEPVYVDPVVFFAAPSHRLAAQATVTFDDLRAEQVVGKFGEAYWEGVRRDLRQRGCAFAQSIDLSSAEAVKSIVASGIGIGLLFASTLNDELRRAELTALPIADPAYEQTYFLVRPDAPGTTLADEVCAFLRERWLPFRAAV